MVVSARFWLCRAHKPNKTCFFFFFFFFCFDFFVFDYIYNPITPHFRTELRGAECASGTDVVYCITVMDRMCPGCGAALEADGPAKM
jgi:hypothetical protein